MRQPEKRESRPLLGRTVFLGCVGGVVGGAVEHTRLVGDWGRVRGRATHPQATLAYDHIDQAQAEKFTRAVGSHNNRPVQPLNARVVIE